MSKIVLHKAGKTMIAFLSGAIPLMALTTGDGLIHPFTQLHDWEKIQMNFRWGFFWNFR